MTDTLVLGGGITGLGCALFLARSGHHVRLVEPDAAAVTADPERALTGWSRPGVPQFGHGHAVHALARRTLEELAPDVLTTLKLAGAGERDFAAPIPLSDREPGDADLVAILVRRPVFEWALRRAVEAETRVEVSTGVRAVGLSAWHPAGKPAGCGIALSDGTTARAAWVVNATGRRSRATSWAAGRGERPPEVLTQYSGTRYYARHFRFTGGVRPPLRDGQFGPAGDLGYLRFSVLEEDSGAFVVTLNTRPGDQELRALRDAATWTRAADAMPPLREWLAGAEPISDVAAMGGFSNMFVRHEPATTIPGLIPVGDALSCTSPTHGWGMSIALHHARLVAGALARDPAPTLACTVSIVAELSRYTLPYYLAAAAEDAERARIEAGEARDVTEPGNPLFIRKIAYAHAARDLRLYRAVQRRIHLIDPPAVLAGDSELLQRAVRLAADAQPAEGLAPGPSRPDLLRALALSTTTIH
jgi:2-polyprenyl-6-methoxyphenol hydroxylase-like FAD-dependent oxidoreductase